MASMVPSTCVCRAPRGAGSSMRAVVPQIALALDLLVRGMAVEGTRGGELAELVTDHVLRDENRHELAAVVHGEGVSDEVGGDRRAAGPSPDHLAIARLVGRVHLLLKVVVHEGTLLD